MARPATLPPDQIPLEAVHAAGRALPAVHLQLEVICSGAALDALAPEWEQLSLSLPLQSPFATPAWNICWWRHLRASHLLIRDRLHVVVLRDANGQLCAVAPMMLSIRPGFAVGGIKVLQFFGADPNITEIRGLISLPQYADAAHATLQQYLLRHAHRWHWIEWQGLSAEQTQQLATPGITRPKDRVICYLPLPAQWETLKAGLSRNMKEAIRKCFNSLQRAQLQAHLLVIDPATQPEQFEAALNTFFHLHKLRATASGGIAHANVFRARKSRRFLSAYLHQAAAAGNVRIFQLSLNGTVVASRIGILRQDQLYLYYSGYDIAWKAYSVMTTLVILIIRWSIETGCHGVNLSTGQDHSKLRWQPQQLVLHNAIQIAPRPLAGLLFKAYTHLRTYPVVSHFSRKK